MDFEEVVLQSKKFPETAQMFDKQLRGKFSKTVIGEDLRRAIVALRSVPRVNWSQDSFHEDNNDGQASTEYIWRATDLSPGGSSFTAEWQSALKLSDSSQRTGLANNGAPKMVASQPNQSEIMRRDSFTVASKRLDRTSDSKCQLVEQSKTSVQMSLFSGENRGKANGTGVRSSVSNTSELTASSAGIVATKKPPPPLPPKPAHLHNFKIKQPVAGKPTLDGKRTIGRGKDFRKTDKGLNGTNLDAVDMYERSLDVLEKDDSDQESEDLTSPRSESPEEMLEELLDSVPAEEFDPLECHITPSVFVANQKVTVKTDLLSFDKLGNKSNGAGHHDAIKEVQKKDAESKLILTSSVETEPTSRTDTLKCEQNYNLSLKPVYVHPKPVTRQLDFSALKKITSEQPMVTREKDLTPEDIFEEIMDYLEAHKGDHRKSSVQGLPPSGSDNNRDDQKHILFSARNEPSQASDYLLENEWLSIYCDQIQVDPQPEMIMKSRISERSSDDARNTAHAESSGSPTEETVFTSKQISEPPLPCSNIKLLSQDGMALQSTNTIFLSSGGKVLQSPDMTLSSPGGRDFPVPNTRLPSRDGKALHDANKRLLSPDEKALPEQNTIFLSPDGKVLRSPNMTLPSPNGKACPRSNTRLPSPDGKTTIASQDTLQSTVKRKPVPPLRETVETYTFAKKDSLMQDIKIAPAIKPKPLTPRKNPKIASNSFFLSNYYSPNSVAELRYEPVRVVYENSENQRATNDSSNAVPCDVNKRIDTFSGKGINKTESLPSRGDTIFLPSDRLVTIITREIELPGCENMTEEEMDLDLETELTRNLDACTASDVECQSIDNLVTSEESLFTSDTKVDTRVIRRPKKFSSSLDVKVPGRLGEILAKTKLKKSQSIENEVVWPHRNEPVNSSQQVNCIQENTTISILGKDVDTSQEAGRDQHVREYTEFVDNRSKGLVKFETTRKISPESLELFKYETSLDKPLVKEETERTVDADSSGSDNEDNYKQTMIRNVRSVEKENTTELEKRPTIQVLSEEVTSQEIVLKIAWPKQKESKGLGRIVEPRKPPCRELKLKRVMRVSDLDSPLNVFPGLDIAQPLPAVTQQSQNALRHEQTPLSLPAIQPDNSESLIAPTSRVDQTVATRNVSDITVEYVDQTNCRKLEHIFDSAIDIQQRDTVKVLRVPMSAVHKVQDIKEAVAAVGSTILGDLQRQPKKRNIRVTCEAVESKSRASLHDQDVTVIRNTIVDTYGPKPAILSGLTNSVQI